MSDLRKEINKTDVYANFEHMASSQQNYNVMMAVMLFLIYIKIFKFINVNKTMGQLNSTLKKVNKKNYNCYTTFCISRR